MQNTFGPSIKALVAQHFFRHLDVDVKVVVGSCISEITRITAPDALEDDDRMKVVFQNGEGDSLADSCSLKTQDDGNHTDQSKSIDMFSNIKNGILDTKKKVKSLSNSLFLLHSPAFSCSCD
ncbi:uncharacterized protein LOC110670960 isoform X2 [Hevea brasiliensis]|nr:uncharacterized protein LOC110670960 isoform X2 [Hevea brasiliensis]